MHDSWMSPKVKVARSALHGRGIVAIGSIARDEPILVWGGPGYTDKAGAIEARKRNRAVMQWDDDVFSCAVEGEAGLDEPFLVNHSCDPNAWMAGPHTIRARMDIAPGEEITVDYAMFEADEHHVSPWECRCGSSLCRGRVTGADWRDPDLRKRYRGRFSPLLTKRIEREESRTKTVGENG